MCVTRGWGDGKFSTVNASGLLTVVTRGGAGKRGFALVGRAGVRSSARVEFSQSSKVVGDQ